MNDEKLGFEDDLMLGVPAGGGRAVLQAISSHLAQRTRVPASVILDGLLEREALGSTGFGEGFALPHAFIPGLITPAKVLVTLREPIEFNAPDDEPVDIFLAVIWPYGQHEVSCNTSPSFVVSFAQRSCWRPCEGYDLKQRL